MRIPRQMYSSFPLPIKSPSGLCAQVNANGSIKRIDYHDIILNLFLGSEIEGGPATVYLRRQTEGSMEALPLTGPRSPGKVHLDTEGMTTRGHWRGIDFRVTLVLAQSAPAWFWHVILINTGTALQKLDLIYTQDIALSDYAAVRLNEYYVSHYVDHTPLSHPRQGLMVASRQNLSRGGRHPWTLIGSLTRGASYATDALQFHGLATRGGHMPPGLSQGLPGVRLQHEHSMVAIQGGTVCLEPGESSTGGFFGWFEEDHPEASSPADSIVADKALSLPEAKPVSAPRETPADSPPISLFTAAPLLRALELTNEDIAVLFGNERYDEERTNDELYSFFTGMHTHVVLKAKELQVLRPHGHIIRTGSSLIPDEASLTSTTWMAGVFNSMVTQGHVNINRFLSTTHGYLRIFSSHGQRMFVELDGGWHLLDVPSAFEMAPDGCRWIYKHPAGLIEIRSDAPAHRHLLTLSAKVLAGAPIRLFVSNHVAINGDDGSSALPVRYEQDGEGLFVRPVPDCDVGRRFPQGGFRVTPLPGTLLDQTGGDELLFADGRSRNQPFLCMVTAPAVSAGFQIEGCLMGNSGSVTRRPAAIPFWDEVTLGLRVSPPAHSPLAGAVKRIAAILPWYVHNALIHYLAPRGLEQYSGGGWGVRDVCQGPLELLLALARPEPVRDLLIRVFRTQNPDGDWPQWFMFFERECAIRPGDSHGDIVFWPLVALAQYLIASGDGALLEEQVVFFHPQGEQHAEQATVWQHVERALSLIDKRVISGTRLAAYGNGDWNDSLQPVQPAMSQHLCSSWTVTLHYQALTTLAAALSGLGMEARAAQCKALAAGVLEDFRRLLLVDDMLAGFAYFPEGRGEIEYLFHPRDRKTGLSCRLLPMIHAIINNLLTPEEVSRHLQIIRTHLLGPDGARLFDRPIRYQGGIQHYFQRAESTSFFGRENGLMYTHAHLRYAEALAHYGDAEGFFLALCQAIPIGIKTLVPSAAPRQANCYFSSSDAAFPDRYQAYAGYQRVMNGAVPLEGGWRVYSSGAGIATALILGCLFGLRQGKSWLVVDPVIPRPLDNMRVMLRLAETTCEVIYTVRGAGCGPSKVVLNGAELPFTRGANPYRTGAAIISMAAFRGGLTAGTNLLTIDVG